MTNIEVGFDSTDPRPAFLLDDVHGAVFNGLDGQQEAGSPIFMLKNVTDFDIHRSQSLSDTQFDSVEFTTL